MLASTEKLLEAGFAEHLFKDRNLAAIFPGSDAKRYALINKALKKGEIVRLHRGVYMLARKYRQKNISAYYLSSRLVPGSVVSLETALSFHGWIPEKVNRIRCVIPRGRARSFETPISPIDYIKIPVNEYEYLTQVSRCESDGQPFLMASPLRALGDYVYTRKIDDDILPYLVDGMRIDLEYLQSLTSNDFAEVQRIYSTKRVVSFLQKLKNLLGK